MGKQIIRSQPVLVGLLDMSLPGAVPFSGSAHVAAGLGNPPTPRDEGLEACGAMGKIVLFLVSSSSFYGGGGGGLMVAPRRPKIGLDWRREHDFQVWGRSGAFGGLVGLPGSPLGRFLVSRGSFWGAFWCPGESSGVDSDALRSFRGEC